MSQSIRSDVGLLFISIQINLMEYAATLKNVLKRRGWLRIPPPYIPPGTPYND
ncbi:hypothetical protein [Bacillus coahuilensis]|nr:hypothetical protein [Bacillus coahuilensis]